MKIAFMTSGTINSSISYRLLSFAKEMKKKGHEVYIFSPRFDRYSNYRDEGITEIEGVKIMRPLQIRSFFFELGLIPYIISSALMLYKLNPDIIFINKANPITISAFITKLFKKIPIIFDSDDLDSEVMKIEKNSLIKIKIVELSEKIIARHADAIVAASKYLQKKYIEQYNNKPIMYVPNGAEFRKVLNLSTKLDKKARIIFIGNINRVNILEPLFTTLKQLEDQGLNPQTIIIGNGIFLNYFKSHSKELKLKNVKFVGHIPQEELYRYVKTGDIGYCYMPNETTTKACSNMKVFQYMQYGVVPVVSNVGDLPLYVSHGKAGYIAKHTNLSDLTTVMKNAIENSRDRNKKIKYINEYASKIYSWKSLAAKLEKSYLARKGGIL